MAPSWRSRLTDAGQDAAQTRHSGVFSAGATWRRMPAPRSDSARGAAGRRGARARRLRVQGSACRRAADASAAEGAALPSLQGPPPSLPAPTQHGTTRRQVRTLVFVKSSNLQAEKTSKCIYNNLILII